MPTWSRIFMIGPIHIHLQEYLCKDAQPALAETKLQVNEAIAKEDFSLEVDLVFKDIKNRIKDANKGYGTTKLIFHLIIFHLNESLLIRQDGVVIFCQKCIL